MSCSFSWGIEISWNNFLPKLPFKYVVCLWLKQYEFQTHNFNNDSYSSDGRAVDKIAKTLFYPGFNSRCLHIIFSYNIFFFQLLPFSSFKLQIWHRTDTATRTWVKKDTKIKTTSVPAVNASTHVDQLSSWVADLWPKKYVYFWIAGQSPGKERPKFLKQTLPPLSGRTETTMTTPMTMMAMMIKKRNKIKIKMIIKVREELK